MTAAEAEPQPINFGSSVVRRLKRVVVCGSSISMVVRPKDMRGLAYPAVLEDYLNRQGRGVWLVENRSRIAGTIDDAVGSATDIVACQPSAVILHLGYTEALLRPHSRRRWYFEHMMRPPHHAPIRFAQKVARKWSGLRSRLHLTEQWVSPRRFRDGLAWLVDYLADETSSKIILVGLTPWSHQIARYAPRSGPAIEQFDGLVRMTAFRSGADYIPFSALMAAASAASPAEIVPDGTHFSAAGHLAVASVLGDHLLASTKRESREVGRAMARGTPG